MTGLPGPAQACLLLCNLSCSLVFAAANAVRYVAIFCLLKPQRETQKNPVHPPPCEGIVCTVATRPRAQDIANKRQENHHGERSKGASVDVSSDRPTKPMTTACTEKIAQKRTARKAKVSPDAEPGIMPRRAEGERKQRKHMQIFSCRRFPTFRLTHRVTLAD